MGLIRFHRIRTNATTKPIETVLVCKHKDLTTTAMSVSRGVGTAELDMIRS